jgi:hypothetical protein
LRSTLDFVVTKEETERESEWGSFTTKGDTHSESIKIREGAREASTNDEEQMEDG